MFVLEMCLKCDPNIQFTIDAIFQGCVLSTDTFPTENVKTILPKSGAFSSGETVRPIFRLSQIQGGQNNSDIYIHSMHTE
jgi:hypothetical protein